MSVLTAALMTLCGAQDQSLGARAKALGGAGSAFDDDPLSLWLNPAGLAPQPGGVGFSLQTYARYEEQRDSTKPGTASPKLNEPEFIPAFFGAVFQVGTPELPQALGVGLVTPYHVYVPFVGPFASPELQVVDQTFHRLRVAYAVDFRLRPLGEEGFFSRLAVGLGVDLSISRVETVRPDVNDNPSKEENLAVSGGLGILLGIYDNGQSFRATLGLAYQGPASHDFGNGFPTPDGTIPTFDWPQQLQVGLAFHLLDRLPLRACFEAQWTDWKKAAEEPAAGLEAFEPALGLSVGVEYRLELAPTIGLLPRMGVRHYDAPWKDDARARLSGSGEYQLLIDTRDERFVVFSFGFGLSWGYREGTQDTLDVAMDVGGDAPGFAFSYTFQF